MNGEPLPLEHGFPVRMVVPGLYGYVSATKWVVDLEVTRFADFKAYWSTRGYSVKAPIKTSSRIDVPRSFAAGQGRRPRCAVAGVAWSQDRGIKKRRGARRRRSVAGRRARRRRTTSTPGASGSGCGTPSPATTPIEVRATDDTGYTQTDKRVPIAPNGSTGWHSVNVTAS